MFPLARSLLQRRPMSRLVHELYAPAHGGDAAYTTPTGDIVQVPSDFAFADTIIATDDDFPTAPTAPLMGNPLSQPPRSSRRRPADMDEHGRAPRFTTHPTTGFTRQTALTGPPPPPSSVPPNAGIVTTARHAYKRAKTEIDSSRHEMQALWSATQDHAEAIRLANEEDPFVRLAGHLRRVRALWSFFEWDRADLMRATWIGVAVFVIVATVGAFALQR